MNPYVIALLVLSGLAIIDALVSRLTPAARVLWAVMIVFLPGVGLAAWLLTRASAYRPSEEPFE
jgi:hypothetical protein